MLWYINYMSIKMFQKMKSPLNTKRDRFKVMENLYHTKNKAYY